MRQRMYWLGWLGVGALGIAFLAGCSGAVASKQNAPTAGAAVAASAKLAVPAAAPPSATEQAIAKAAKAGKYAFVLFYRPDDPAGRKMKATFGRVEPSLRARAVFCSVDAFSADEAQLIQRYRVSQAPLPLTLVMAPNGAVVGAFTKAVDEKTLRAAFVSAKTADTMKSLQDRKLVALCLQGPRTKHNAESRQAAEQFVADSTLGGQAVLITADPRQAPDLLKRCGIASAPTESTIVVLLPPGQLVAKVAGATTKQDLLAKLQAALASCGSGCGPSGCGN